MNNALGYTPRGRLFCDLLRRALAKMWKMEKMEQCSAIVAEAVNLDDVDHETKNFAKMHTVLRSFEADPTAQDLKTGIVLTQPVQHYLNRVMKADRAACESHLAMDIDPDCIIYCGIACL